MNINNAYDTFSDSLFDSNRADDLKRSVAFQIEEGIASATRSHCSPHQLPLNGEGESDSRTEKGRR